MLNNGNHFSVQARGLPPFLGLNVRKDLEKGHLRVKYRDNLARLLQLETKVLMNVIDRHNKGVYSTNAQVCRPCSLSHRPILAEFAYFCRAVLPLFATLLPIVVPILGIAVFVRREANPTSKHIEELEELMPNANVEDIKTTVAHPATTFTIPVTFNIWEWPIIVEAKAKGTWTAHDAEKRVECVIGMRRHADGRALVFYQSFENETPLSSWALMARSEERRVGK